jgi:hypothetical protein
MTLGRRLGDSTHPMVMLHIKSATREARTRLKLARDARRC